MRAYSRGCFRRGSWVAASAPYWSLNRRGWRGLLATRGGSLRRLLGAGGPTDLDHAAALLPDLNDLVVSVFADPPRPWSAEQWEWAVLPARDGTVAGVLHAATDRPRLAAVPT